ncbi:hypothetical protein, partial [Klebsiella pneumoniae]|uniref:hypothetical protein n=1 Tax=Klebsiella pneumoniae TaxID=573 RepID=UPI00210BBFEB
MDIAEYAPFGCLKYIHVVVNTCSRALFVSIHDVHDTEIHPTPEPGFCLPRGISGDKDRQWAELSIMGISP